jgi:hypothetical protein
MSSIEHHGLSVDCFDQIYESNVNKAEEAYMDPMVTAPKCARPSSMFDTAVHVSAAAS